MNRITKNNLGRKINLNNAKKALQKEINNKKNEIRNRYARGEFVGRYNNQLRRLENILKNVNRKLRIRAVEPIQRHFTPQNLSRMNFFEKKIGNRKQQCRHKDKDCDAK